MEATATKNNFKQLVVWRGTFLGDSTPQDFEDWMKEEGFTAKFAEEVETLPDRDKNGKIIPETGGRSDLLFWISDSDVSKFALWRIPYGMSWYEDAIDNGYDKIIPDKILEKYPYTWKN